MDPEGNNQQVLADASSLDTFMASWSPDGSQIVFHSNKEGNHELYRINSDGSNETNITISTTAEFEPDWSPVK
jgi:TolB protein